MSALFSKKKKDDDKKIKDVAVTEEVVQEEKTEESALGSKAFSGMGGAGTHKILRGFYVSEKASLGNAANQYIFRVFEGANKSEIKKEVVKLFNVQIKSVKIVNIPKKRRDFGKHPGYRGGFKKAIVVLKEGFSIGQAKP